MFFVNMVVFFSRKNKSLEHWYENIILRKVPRTKTNSVDSEGCYGHRNFVIRAGIPVFLLKLNQEILALAWMGEKETCTEFWRPVRK